MGCGTMEEWENAPWEHVDEQDWDVNNVTPSDGGCSSDGVLILHCFHFIILHR